MKQERRKKIIPFIIALAMTLSPAGSVLAENSRTVCSAGNTVSEKVQDTIKGTLRSSGAASDALRPARRTYFSGKFKDSYGNQLGNGTAAKRIYNGMYKAYVANRGKGDMTVTFSPPLEWNKSSASEYQEVLLFISYSLQSAYDAFVYDYPEVFWLGNVSYSFSAVYSDGKGSISSVTLSARDSYTGASGEIKKFDAAVNTAASAVSAGLPSNAGRYDKVKAIHDYLCDRLTYNGYGEWAHSAGGAFLHQGVVCEGYAKSFMILCRKLNIPCILIVGNAGEDHMWNYVQMEDQNWYLVDVTWDDTDRGMISYTYFLAGSNSPSDIRGIDTVGEERRVYTNFSGAENTQNFTYPILSSRGYILQGNHTHIWTLASDQPGAPTCTKKGYYIYRCTCGETSKVEEEPLGHSFIKKTYVYNNDATAEKDGTKSWVCDRGCGKVKMTVRAPGTKLVIKTKKIKGVPKSLTLKVGTAKTLKPKLNPKNSSQKITYSSSVKKVASVSSKGKIKARKRGRTVITVKSGTKKVKCRVTVK